MLKSGLAAAAFALALGGAFAARADIFESANAPGMCINASSGGVSILPCDGSPNPDFATKSIGGGRIIVAGVRCLQMAGENNMPNLVQWSPSACTKFSFGNNGPVSGDGLCLDVKGGGKKTGTKVIGWRCNGQTNQRWLRTGTGKTVADNGDDLMANATQGRLSANHAPDMCLSVAGSRVELRPCGSATKFKLSVGVPATPIMAPGNKCLDGQGSQGEQVRVVTCQGGLASAQWTFTTNGLLRSANGLCADVDGAKRQAGTPVIFFKCSGNPNQRFTLTP